jgi:hypothetical protein
MGIDFQDLIFADLAVAAIVAFSSGVMNGGAWAVLA